MSRNIQTSIVKGANGSCLVGLGNTKVIASVFGPKQDQSNPLDEGMGGLNCQVSIAEWTQIPVEFRSENQSSDQEQDRLVREHEMELSKRLSEAMTVSVALDRYPGTNIDLFVHILHDDGQAFSACISAASIALASAEIEMYDLVSSCTILFPEGETPVLAPNSEEMELSTSFVCMGLMPNRREMTYLDCRGIGFKQLESSIELCEDVCVTNYEWMSAELVNLLK